MKVYTQVWCERAKAAKSHVRCQQLVPMVDDGYIRVLVANPRNLEYVANMDSFDLLLLNLKDVSVTINHLCIGCNMIPLYSCLAVRSWRE